MPKPKPYTKAVIIAELDAKAFDKAMGFAAGLQHGLNIVAAIVQQNQLSTHEREVLGLVTKALRADQEKIIGVP